MTDAEREAWTKELLTMTPPSIVSVDVLLRRAETLYNILLTHERGDAIVRIALALSWHSDDQ